MQPQSKIPGISNILRRAIRATGASVKDIADRAGLSHGTVSEFLNGESINLRSAGRLCQVLNLTLVELEPRPVFKPGKVGRPKGRKNRGKGEDVN